MDFIKTLYPNGRYIISTSHPHFHPDKEEYKKGEKQTLWVRGRSYKDCIDALNEMKESGEFTAIFFYPSGCRPAKGCPIPEYTLEVIVNDPSMNNWPNISFFNRYY